MSRTGKILLITGLLVIAGTAGLILQLRAAIKLGAPGVKMAPIPTYDPDGNVIATNSVPLPAKVLDYEGKVEPIAHETLGWLPKDTTYGQVFYTAPDQFRVQLSVVVMGADRTSIHQPQYCLPGAGWQIDEEKVVTIPMTLPHPYTLQAKRMILTAGARIASGTPIKAVFIYWFVADDALSIEHSTRMWTIGKEMLQTRQLQRWGYVSCFSVCHVGQEEATFERMKQFAIAAVPEFQLAAGPPIPSQSRAP